MSTTTATTNPCPTGCALPTGHPYDSVVGDSLYRCHEQTLAQVHGHAVTMLWDEVANLDESDPVIAWSQLQLTTPTRNLLSPDQAAEVGQALLAAADKARQIGQWLS